MESNRSLADLRAEFKSNRLIAMPIAGTICWAAIGVCGLFLRPSLLPWAVFIGTGMTFYVAMFIGPLVGDPVVRRGVPLSELDKLFMLTVLMANLAWAIAIPFFLVEPTSLPLSVGILSGLMWIPISWLLEHWVGLFHGITRTVLIVAAWYLFPDARYVAIPAVIVIIYIISIVALVRRHTAFHSVALRPAQGNSG